MVLDQLLNFVSTSPHGVEKQMRTNCKSCGLFVSYQCPGSPYTYFLSDALSRRADQFKQTILRMRGGDQDEEEVEDDPMVEENDTSSSSTSS